MSDEKKMLYAFLVFVAAWFLGHTLTKDRGIKAEVYRNQHVPKRTIHTNWR